MFFHFFFLPPDELYVVWSYQWPNGMLFLAGRGERRWQLWTLILGDSDQCWLSDLKGFDRWHLVSVFVLVI